MRVTVVRRSRSMSVRTGESRYWIRIEEWSLWHRVRGRVYHWYDMRIPIKVPGWRLVERLLRAAGAEMRMGLEGEPDPRWRDRLLTWPFSQDIRCFQYNDEAYCDARHITQFEVDEQTYRLFDRKDDREAESG